MRQPTRLAALAAAPLLGCAAHQVDHNPAPRVAIPAAFSGGGSEQPAPDAWWTDFRDPELDSLVQRVLREGLQIRASWARLTQARALARQATSGKWPQVTVDGQGSQQRIRNFAAASIPPEVRDQIGLKEFLTVENFTMSAGASYEVDLWRRIGSQASAAVLDAMAARDDVEAMAVSLAAEVTETWFDLIAQRAQRNLLSEQLATNKTFLELVELRFQQGLASALDIYQQRQQFVATRSRLANVDAAIATLGNRLAVLVGQPPPTVVAGERDTLPDLPPLPGRGLPADLLVRRPDVRALRRRVEAADYRIAAAVADRLPALRLTGSAGFQSRSIATLLSTPVWSLVAAIAEPLLDGGRRRAEVARARAVLEELVMRYGQTLLAAMSEVEGALIQERQQRVFISDLEEQLDIARASLREARARYRAGLSEYLPVLTALQSTQQVELTLLQARRQLLSFRVQLCRALGGTWTRQLQALPPGGTS